MVRTSLNVAYLLVTSLIILAVALAFLVYRPMLFTLSEKRQRGQELEQNIAERKAFLTSSESKKSVLEQQHTNEQILSVALPVNEDMDGIVRILNRVATSSGGTISGLRNTSVENQRDTRIRATEQRGGEQLPPHTLALAAQIEFVGSYQQLRVFLGELEKSPRLIDVSSLDISRSADLITVQLNLRFYRYGSTDT